MLTTKASTLDVDDAHSAMQCTHLAKATMGNAKETICYNPVRHEQYKTLQKHSHCQEGL